MLIPWDRSRGIFPRWKLPLLRWLLSLRQAAWTFAPETGGRPFWSSLPTFPTKNLHASVPHLPTLSALLVLSGLGRRLHL